MRDNGPVTGREIKLDDGDLIVSKTDTKGKITFVNETFIKISGFDETELIGAPHNILRHPDMPKEAFQDLWETIKSGNPWEGFVKNRTKSGDHYWVRANVTPIVENNEIAGFISIRSKPSQEEINFAEEIYKSIRNKTAKNITVKEGKVLRTDLGSKVSSIVRNITSLLIFQTLLICLFVGMGAFMSSSLSLPIVILTCIGTNFMLFQMISKISKFLH